MLIIGTGGFASDFIGTFLKENPDEDIVLYNDTCKDIKNLYSNHFRVITSMKEAQVYLQTVDNRFLTCIGDGRDRKEITKKFKKMNGTNPTYISQSSYVSPLANINKEGVIIMQCATISSTATIGEGSVIYLNSAIGHESMIREYCLISANVVMSGASIGDYTLVGIGASLKPGIQIGDNCVVGTGSVVTKSFPNHSTIMGNPAIAKKRNHTK